MLDGPELEWPLLPLERRLFWGVWVDQGCTYDLQLHGLSFQLDRSNLEIDANGTNVTLRVGIIREPKEQARLCRRLSAFNG